MNPPQQRSPLTAEPQWQPAQRFTRQQLPSAVRRWLLDDGSLTQRLQQLSGGDFRVRRLSQSWQRPRPSEQRLLNLPTREQALVREVELLCGGQPRVFARSVFPQRALHGDLRHLRRLENRSLGAILFAHCGVRRSPFELASITPEHHYIPEHLVQDAPAWGRRSRFDLGGHSLMVSEIFLEGFNPWDDFAPNHRSQRGRVRAPTHQETAAGAALTLHAR